MSVIVLTCHNSGRAYHRHEFEVEELTTNSLLLTKEDMTNPEIVPQWVIEEYKNFHEVVTDRTFPCYFGMTGEKKGELRYSYISHDNWEHLPQTIQEFIDLFDVPEGERLIRHGFFLFVEPEREERSVPHYRDYFWRILQFLHREDKEDWPAIIQRIRIIICGHFPLQGNLSSCLGMPLPTSSERREILGIA